MPSITGERLCTVVKRRICQTGADAAECRPRGDNLLMPESAPTAAGLKS